MLLLALDASAHIDERIRFVLPTNHFSPLTPINQAGVLAHSHAQADPESANVARVYDRRTRCQSVNRR